MSFLATTKESVPIRCTFHFETVRVFLNYFARKKYESDEAKNEFFNSFINRVILYDDKVLIFYNTDPNSPTSISTDENTEIIEYFNQNNAKENSLESSGFKRVSLGGEKGIRTLDTFLYTRFPVVRLRPTRPSLHKGVRVTISKNYIDVVTRMQLIIATQRELLY